MSRIGPDGRTEGQELERQRLPGKPAPHGILAGLQLGRSDRRVGGRDASPLNWRNLAVSINLPRPGNSRSAHNGPIKENRLFAASLDGSSTYAGRWTNRHNHEIRTVDRVACPGHPRTRLTARNSEPAEINNEGGGKCSRKSSVIASPSLGYHSRVGVLSGKTSWVAPELRGGAPGRNTPRRKTMGATAKPPCFLPSAASGIAEKLSACRVEM